ncbi:hypothetical protein I302_107383 [Kwoniella bestiolae CBS 10118]|uniref:NAD-dependent epimerase/dehydratase domain-containing protein n=1 Tax=Kwoniella bestiolae CBS 10118 TaxID=1296100 RepID=A0A1B9FYP1_9TREE|nr:hypothetical protein I302_06879 [Kwoniella bestiolae CBS 10118]OCF23893.1 hypothetical protein I302_06879 [Kwoniella bestiolae CBS 10118]
MKVFITGASGWVGSHVVPELQRHGHSITAIARSDSSAAALEKQGVKVVRGGLEDTDILHSSAKEADAVIHLAYIHDFSDYGGRPAQIDYAAIRAMASALEGTNKPFVGTGGALGLAEPQTEDQSSAFGGPRKAAEDVAFSFIEKGVRPVVVRLAPTTHGEGDHGFMAHLVQCARSSGFSAYIKDSRVRWSAVHVEDAAVLYRLAIEGDLKGGTILHGVAESGIPFSTIAKKIGDILGVETKELVDEEEIKKHFGWMAMLLKFDCNAQNGITKEKTGWTPKGKGLLEDLETGKYFA